MLFESPPSGGAFQTVSLTVRSPLALANHFGWIADNDATTMFAILPALWVASTRPGRCRLGKVAA